MKKVITGEELYECAEQAIDLLCGTVKKTLGPRGSNAIIDHSLFSPFITNDGVTIARNIESDDARVNTILTLAKEASIKTDETVGDGTTTTLILLESIFKKGLEKIASGVNPNILKKELNQALEEVIKKIKEESKSLTEKDYFNIASIAASDENIGSLISTVYLKLKGNGALKIEESNTRETYFTIINGYTFETIVASPYFLKGKKEIEYQNAYFLMINKEIDELEEISEVINFFIDKKAPAIILANDYRDEVINEILSLNFNGVTNVTLLKMPEYGTHQMDLLNDLEIITKSKIVKVTDEIRINNLGKCKVIKIDKENVVISNDLENALLKEHINKIKKELEKEKDTYESDYLNIRLAKLTNGRGIIYVGANTMTEAREKKMRFDDALCAIESTKDGIVPGSGLVFLKIANELKDKNNGYEILKSALTKPFYQILENAGINKEEVFHKIEESNFNILYNVLEEKYELISETKVIDPTSVVVNTIINAISIASMLLTTSSLIINEYQEHQTNNVNNEL